MLLVFGRTTATSVRRVYGHRLHFNETATIVSTIALSSAMWVTIERHAFLPIYNMTWFPQPIMDSECNDVRYIYSCTIFVVADKSAGLINDDADKATGSMGLNSS